MFVCFVLFVCLFGPIEGHAFKQMAAVHLLGKHMLGNNSHHEVSDTVPDLFLFAWCCMDGLLSLGHGNTQSGKLQIS